MHDTITQARETTLRDFTSVVFRRKGVILTVLLAAVVTVVFLNTATPPSFLSSSRVLVSRGEAESVFNTRYKLLSWEEELNSEIEVLQSAALSEKAQRVVDESSATDSEGNPVTLRSTSVDATTTGKASVLIVNYTAPDPVEAREALRALTHAYMEWRNEARALPYVDRFFEEELEGVRERLTDWEQRRADFMTEEGIVNIRTEGESLLRQREDAAFQVTQARASLADFAARLDAVEALQQEKRLNEEVEIYGLGDGNLNDESILFSLRKELVTRRSQYYEKLGRLTDGHPEVMAARDVVHHLERQLEIEIENYVRFLEARIAVAQARVASLEATIQGIDEELYGMPDKQARLAQYDRIVDALKTDYETLVAKHIDAKVESSGRSRWKVILLQPASVAAEQRTRDYVRLALVPLFALLIGLALAFVLDGLDHSLKDATDVEQHLRIQVLGSLSRIR